MVGKYDVSHCGDCGSCEEPLCGICNVDNWVITIAGISNGVGFDACNGCGGLNGTFIVPYIAIASSLGGSCGFMIASNLCTISGGGSDGSVAACCYELLGIDIGIGTGGGNPGGPCTGRIHVLIRKCINGRSIEVRVASPQGGFAQFAKYLPGTSLCTANGESIPKMTSIGSNGACNFSGASCTASVA